MSSSSFLNLDMRLIVFFLLYLLWTSFLSTHIVDGLKGAPIALFVLLSVSYKIHLNRKRLVMGLFNTILPDAFVRANEEQGSNDY